MVLEMEVPGKYSCNTPAETLEWIEAIIEFLNPYRFFFEANVVNFLKDRLWEAVDKDWIACLQNERVEYLLQIPSGVVQEHWPASLKEYVLTAKMLAFPREQAKLQKILPGVTVTSLNPVILQGMNPKKKHEVEILSSLVNCITKSVGAHTVIDVGAGQGYLSQVLAFEYQLSVVAIDASSHHGVVTSKRAERIKKHYLAKLHNSGSSKGTLNMPRTITSHILSSSTLKELSNYCCQLDEKELNGRCLSDDSHKRYLVEDLQLSSTPGNADSVSSLVLAGLHACGDLSVTMLRAFSECKEVKAIISVGCCYNLLSEGGQGSCDSGFPVSKGVRLMGISLGKNARDLACQSAERWRGLENEAGVQNFDLHAFRAIFQMVLERYYPEVLLTSPSIGRQGKALCRQQRKKLPSSGFAENKISTSELETYSLTDGVNFAEGEGLIDNCDLFLKFSYSGLRHLRIKPLQEMDLPGLWRECQSYAGLIGPYWSLRAALGPVLESLLLLDRLLFLQEQESAFEVVILSIFDPALSPRNLAIIARKS